MSRKLLLADDSITIQKVIGITFANEDYLLTIVDNGDTALEKARAERPDLILADVFMPGKNGYELAAAVKQDPALQGVPVLLLAGTFEPFDEEKAVSSGADSWISKPFESQALISKVEELLAKSQAAAPVAPAQPAAVPPVAPVQPAAAPPVAPAAPAPPAADPWGDSGAVEAPIFEDDTDFIVDDSSGSAEETQNVWADTASIPLQEPEVVAVQPTAPPVPPAAPPVRPVAPPAQSAAPVAPAGVESQIAAMSETDLTKIVERVAGAMLERIAWEVVPDLAENLIKDEIRKIKENA